jgi:hypothetical protein
VAVIEPHVSELKLRPTRKDSSLRRRAGLAPRAAGEVDAENQYLDRHGLMVAIWAKGVKFCGLNLSVCDDYCLILSFKNVNINTQISNSTRT